ncbi:MAG: type I DNA topoisomerase [Kiritimatiellae bacterium]|nr:type I DNA topoisomerase [Kiritimatiellia bacterium]
MATKLVIVESPAKAKSIGKFLGKEYKVLASKGHIRDLPEHAIGVDIEHGFEPKYVLSKDKTKTVIELKKAAKESEEIFLAPDPDREGEAIAWHLHETLLPAAKDKTFYRVQYNEITPRAVREAIAHPGQIDMDRVNAQQARRVLDRIVGYMVSPMLWRRIRRGLSAGRVQSVALRLLAEREREIQSFKAEEYWLMGAKVRRTTAPLDPFNVRLSRIDNEKAAIANESEAAGIKADLEGTRLRVADVKTREVSRHALPPFITSTLQQAASSVLGFSPGHTMSLAQKLYEGGDAGVGLITYMRTDSVALSADARSAAQTYITGTFGEAYFSQNYYKSRAGAQEAHEAIRPTDVTRTPESLAGKLEPAALRLYELIWKRFVASLMASARIAQKTVSIASEKVGAKHVYTFTATSSDIVFDGFLKVMALDLRKKKAAEGEEDEDSDEVAQLPPLVPGDEILPLEWLAERKETKPPARYSEAALIKALEANGVGRPSTYAATVDTLVTREYANREKRQLIPTQLGLDVNDLLVEKMPDLFNVGFTAEMEESLDKVEEGGVEWQSMLSDFYGKFHNWLEQAREPPADRAKVDAVLALLAEVKEWAAPTKRGKRTYSDEKFVTSVREQLAEGDRPVSEKQLSALANMAVRYRAQIADAERKLGDLGFGDLVTKDREMPDLGEAQKRFDVLAKVELTESQSKFVESLSRQCASGRKLSPKQLAIIDRILCECRASIPDFDSVKSELGLQETEEKVAEDKESPFLIQMLSQVKEWKPAVTKGKRTYDDADFFKSVSDQFARKHALSERQRFALKRLCGRYRAQIPDYETYAAQLGLNTKPAGKGDEK